MADKLVTNEKTARTVLSKSGISGVDYAVNPYTGCSHNCVYCYASFMKRFSGHAEPWGKFVDAKINAPELLRKELCRAKAGKLMMSSVTDCYQPMEKKYELTRRCLETLVFHPDMELSILTKSALVTRDIDILRAIPKCTVGMTVTSADDRISRLLEPGATPAGARIDALQTLHESGIDVWAFFGPIVPYFCDSQEAIGEVFKRLEKAGVRKIVVDATNFYPAVRSRVAALFRRHSPEAGAYLEEALRDHYCYTEELRHRVHEASERLDTIVEIIF